MKQKKVTITASVFLLIVIIGFMSYDLFFKDNSNNKNLYEYNIDKLKKIDKSLICYTNTANIKLDITEVKGIAINNDNQLFVAGNQTIAVYDLQTQKKIKTINTTVSAKCISVSDKGKIYLGAKNHIECYDSTGKLEKIWNVINNAVYITSILPLDSFVFVADAGNKAVHKYSKTGKLLSTFGKKNREKNIEGFFVPSPYFDLAKGRDGELWAVDPGRHTLKAYDINGNLKSSWRRSSMQLDGFSGCCNPSHIAILSNGSFVTTEKGIERIKIHSPNGDFICVVASPEQFEKGTKGIDVVVDNNDRIIILDPVKQKISIFKANGN